MKKQTRRLKAIGEKLAKEQRLANTFKEYPEFKKYHKLADVKRFAEIVNIYPDLKALPFKLAIKAGEFRNELTRIYIGKFQSEMANARGINLVEVSIKLFKDKLIPTDLPALSFLQECVICEKKEIGICLCPSCWIKLRKALKIKTEQVRAGWHTWGYEANCLHLDEVAKLLGMKMPIKTTQQKLVEVN